MKILYLQKSVKITEGNGCENRKEFALDIRDFFNEFEKSFSMHTLSVEFRELTDKDLHRAIEEVLKNG